MESEVYELVQLLRPHSMRWCLLRQWFVKLSLYWNHLRNHLSKCTGERGTFAWEQRLEAERFLCSVFKEDLVVFEGIWLCLIHWLHFGPSGRFTSRRWIHIARVRFLVLNLEHQRERHWLPNYLADSRHFAIGCTNGFITPPLKVMSFSSCTECMHSVSNIRRYVCWQGLEVLSNNIIAVHLSSSLILDCNCHLRIS